MECYLCGRQRSRGEQALRNERALALPVRLRRHAEQRSECTEEMKLRHARHLREHLELDRLLVARLDVVHGKRDATMNLLARGAARARNRLHLAHDRAMREQQPLEQVGELLVEPLLIIVSRERVLADVAHHRRDDAIVRLQALGEFEAEVRERRFALEQPIGGCQERREHFIEHARTESDLAALHLGLGANLAGVRTTLVQHEEVVVIDHQTAAVERVLLAAAPRRHDHQWPCRERALRVACTRDGDAVLIGHWRLQHPARAAPNHQRRTLAASLRISRARPRLERSRRPLRISNM